MAYLLRVSRGCEYAMGATKVFAKLEVGHTIQAEDVAQRAESPTQFTASLLTQLTKFGIHEGSYSEGRGYRLASSAESIGLLNIIEALDGGFEMPWCFMDGSRPSDSAVPCQFHRTWTGTRKSVRAILETKLLAEPASADSTQVERLVRGGIHVKK